MHIEPIMDLELVKDKRYGTKKRWGLTNYGFGCAIKIKKIEAGKSCGLVKLWIRC